MVQLGPSLDAVYLKASLEDWPIYVMIEPGQGLLGSTWLLPSAGTPIMRIQVWYHLQGVFEDDENIHLVMELCSGGGILDSMKDGTLTEARVADIIRSVLRFIAQCHAKGIIYRDVKPDNFLFLTPEEKSPIRATDFGLSIR